MRHTRFTFARSSGTRHAAKADGGQSNDDGIEAAGSNLDGAEPHDATGATDAAGAGGAAAGLHDASELNAGSIDQWLGVLARLMRLPDSTRSEVCAELREHLRERRRDLVLGGMDDDEAARAAIAELGETAGLARRLEQANRPRTRRLLMNLSLIGLGAGFVALGVFTFSPNSGGSGGAGGAGGPPPVVFQQPQAKQADSLAGKSVSVELKEVTFADAVEYVAKSAGMKAQVRWNELQELGLNRDVTLTVKLGTAAVANVMDVLVAEVGRGLAEPLAWRAENGVIEVGSRLAFDRRDVVLVAYDVTDILNNLTAITGRNYNETVQDVCRALTMLVDPENWRDNGGDLGNIQVVGGTMFIQAPKRMQSGVEWILQQLRASALGREGNAAAGPHAGAANGGAGAAGNGEVPILKDIPLIDRFSKPPAGALRGVNVTNTGDGSKPIANVAPAAKDERSVKAMENLRTIGQAAMLYAADNKDRLPANIEALVNLQYLQPASAHSPFGPMLDGSDEFWFLSGEPKFAQFADPSKQVLCYDRAMRLAGGPTAVLYADTHVEMMWPPDSLGPDPIPADRGAAKARPAEAAAP